jgi:hypothetical protein
MEDLVALVHGRRSDASTSIGSGHRDSWPLGSESTSGSWDPRVSCFLGPEVTSRSWDPVVTWSTGPVVGLRGLGPDLGFESLEGLRELGLDCLLVSWLHRVI